MRAWALSHIREAGAGIVRIFVDWRSLVASPLPGSDLADPGSSAYDFSNLDAVVEGAVEAGLPPLLVICDAPAFAEAPDRWRYAFEGTWDPDPQASRRSQPR